MFQQTTTKSPPHLTFFQAIQLFFFYGACSTTIHGEHYNIHLWKRIIIILSMCPVCGGGALPFSVPVKLRSIPGLIELNAIITH